MKLRFLFFTICYFILSFIGSATAALPPVVFTTVSSAEGLPQNTGRAMLQDSEGFIWVGTEDGLVRFDGHSMLSFRKNHQDADSLSDNYIESLKEDQNNRLWVGTMGGGLNIIDKNRQHVTRINDLSNEDIRDIATGRAGEKLWLGTGSGLHCITLSQLTDQTQDLENLTVQSVPIVDRDGNFFHRTINGIILDGDYIWFCTRGDGVGRYDTGAGETLWFRKGDNGLTTNTFNAIYKGDGHGIWLGSQDQGLIQLVEIDGKISFTTYNTAGIGLNSNDVMAIETAGKDTLWLGTWNGGLALFDTNSKTAKHYRHQLTNQYSIPSDIIMNIMRTRSGQVWLGTFDKGVSWFHPSSPFHTFRANILDDGGLKSNLIWSFAPEDDKALWIGTSKGLGRLDLRTNEYSTPQEVHPQDLWDSVKNDDIRALMMDEEELWVAGRKQGVHKLSLGTGVIVPLSDLLTDGQTLSHPYIRIIYKAHNGIIWFGASKGLNRFDPVTGKVQSYMPEEGLKLSLPHYRIRSIFEDSLNRTWVGTSNGLMVLDDKGNILRVIREAEAEIGGLRLAGNGIRGIGEDGQKRLWFATEGGISIYDEKRQETVILRENQGLPSNSVYCAIPENGYMWASTLNGLARINTGTLQVTVYSADDGLPDNEFNFNAWQKLPDERLAFGTLAGFTLISPQKIPEPEETGYVPPLYVAPFLYKEDGKRYGIPPQHDGIEIDWLNNKISFSYSSLDYRSENSVSYELKLTGAEESWSSSEGQHLATFTGLTAGKYSFYVRAKDHHGQWMVESTPINFTVSPPPWKTWFAFALYAVLALALLILCTALYNRRLKARSLYLADLVTQRTTELEKSNKQLTESHLQLDTLLSSRERFFRAIAHELRTPLTLILSLLESYRNDGVEKSTMLTLIEQRASRIDTLLDSLLNLANKTAIRISEPFAFEVSVILEDILQPYRQQVALENKRLITDVAIDDAYLMMDQETFMIVVSSLLSNACKYTEKDGEIVLKAICMDNWLKISVTDDGVGVGHEDKDRIFNWFERASNTATENGWGIGLAFSKDEVEFAGGTIQLNQAYTKGAEFVVTLPLVHTDEKLKDLPHPHSIVANGKPEHPILLDTEKSYTLLVVEDDPDLLEHLISLFPSHWLKLTALDAETGGELVKTSEPDIIITDLMLPGESGFDFTKKLKGASATAHIPVVILTALNTEENRLTGLGLSADSFLGKPFKNLELQLKVAGLLENRQKTLQRAKQIILSQLASDTTPTVKLDEGQGIEVGQDHVFFTKLQKTLDSDKAISTMTLDQAAVKLGMSKRSLQREMEKIGINWTEYRRLRKIRYAMTLLQDKSNNVSDVAELAGYSSAAHFAKTFKDIAGESPSVWRKHKGQVGF